MTAQQIIDRIDNATTTFLGNTVQQFNYLWEKSDELARMFAAHEINGTQYYAAIKLLYSVATPNMLAMDYEIIR